jgi:hypothetical protein
VVIGMWDIRETFATGALDGIGIASSRRRDILVYRRKEGCTYSTSSQAPDTGPPPGADKRGGSTLVLRLVVG